MMGVFASLRDAVPRGDKLRQPHTEGLCNKLHFRISFWLLIACSALVTCMEWIGNGRNISCVMEGPEDSWTIPVGVINTYCYVLTTFVLPKSYSGVLGEDFAQPGVGAFGGIKRKGEISHKAYYQWVPFVLFLQAIMFYIPHAIYKIWEGGKVKNIIAGLNQFILDKKERAGKEKMLADYVAESLNTHNYWAMKMLFVDFLNLINVVGQIYFIDIFLGGEFSTFGTEVVKFLEFDPEDRIDPMAVVFPKVTKCSFYKYGSSGTIQTRDAMCILPINIINEKIFVFLWFWLIVLTGITVIGLGYHCVIMMTPTITKMVLRNRALHQPIDIDHMGKHFEVGDWKLLHILAKNMEPLVFGEFMRELNFSLEEKLETDMKKSQRRPLVV